MGGSPSPPQPQDPAATARAQTGMNIGSAEASDIMNMINQYNPYGSLKYNQTGQQSVQLPVLDSNGNPTGKYTTYNIPTFSATQSYTPTGQQILKYQEAAQLNAGSAEQSLSGQIANEFAHPLNLPNVPTPYGLPGTPAWTNMPGAPQYAQLAQTPQYTQLPSGNVNQRLSSAPQLQYQNIRGPQAYGLTAAPQVQRQGQAPTAYDYQAGPQAYGLDTGGPQVQGQGATPTAFGYNAPQNLQGSLPNAPDLSNTAVDQAMYQNYSPRIQYQQQQESTALDAKLRAQGVTPGSQAYDDAMKLQSQAHNDQWNQMYLTGRGEAVNEIQQGYQNQYQSAVENAALQAQNYTQQLAGQQQAYGQQQQNWADILAGGQQTFAQQQAAQQARLAAQQQQFGQSSQEYQQNLAAQQQNYAQQQQNWADILAGGQQTFAQQQARQQAIMAAQQQQFGQRQQGFADTLQNQQARLQTQQQNWANLTAQQQAQNAARQANYQNTFANAQNIEQQRQQRYTNQAQNAQMRQQQFQQRYSDLYQNAVQNETQRQQNFQNQMNQSQQANALLQQYYQNQTQRTMQQYNFPLQELSAVMGQGAPQQLQFGQTPQVNIAPANYEGDVANYYNAEMQAYQAQVQQQNAMMGGIFSMIGSLGGMAMMSDERMKEDIEQIGELDDGQPLYKFRYKFGGPTQIGLMAQDVEETHPEAVISIGGIKYVDYDRATRT